MPGPSWRGSLPAKRQRSMGKPRRAWRCSIRHWRTRAISPRQVSGWASRFGLEELKCHIMYGATRAGWLV
eukprot:11195633-Lingulodinium_polyedra.AAC.1